MLHDMYHTTQMHLNTFVGRRLHSMESGWGPTVRDPPPEVEVWGRGERSNLAAASPAASVASLKVAKAGLVTPKLSQRRCTVLLNPVRCL